MRYEIRDIEPTQITVELDNDSACRAPAPVHAVVTDASGRTVVSEKTCDTNVITIDGLQPDTAYILELGGKAEFVTAPESFRLDVRSFGAAGDGVKDDTAPVQAAIMACPENGTVYIGRGEYLCGPLFLKSNIRIFLEEGAVIAGDTDRSRYPLLPGVIRADEYYDTGDTGEYNLGTWEGNPLSCFASLITGIGVSNVRIFGQGVIDGRAGGSDWWVDPKIRRGAWRPRLIFLNGCSDITIQGVTLRNSPSWCVHPYYCRDVRILGVTVRNPDASPNTDGIDPESSTGVSIIGTDISVGDDCIAVKSGKIYMGTRHRMPASGVTVRNCYLRRGHGSVTIGSECAGGVTGVHVSRCVFDNTDRGLRIKTRRGRGSGSVVDDIVFEHIVMKDVRMPFCVNMYYFCDPDGHSGYCQSKEELPADERTPEVRSITARDITCTGVDVSLLAAYGLPERKIGRIALIRVNASFRPEADRTPAVPLMMDDLEPMSGRGIYARNVKTLRLEDVNITGSEDPAPDTAGVERIEADAHEE